MVHFSFYKAVPHIKGYYHDHYVIASDFTQPESDTIKV